MIKFLTIFLTLLKQSETATVNRNGVHNNKMNLDFEGGSYTPWTWRDGRNGKAT